MRTSGVAFLLLACLAGCSDAPALRANVEPESDVAIGFSDFEVGTQKSAGVHICTEGDSVRLAEAEPIHAEGSVRYLGAVLLSGSGSFVGAANGFPPEDIDDNIDQVPIDQGTVTGKCQDGPSSDQVVFGVERIGDSGGRVVGFRIFYESGGQSHILEIEEFAMILCGDNSEYCDS